MGLTGPFILVQGAIHRALIYGPDKFYGGGFRYIFGRDESRSYTGGIPCRILSSMPPRIFITSTGIVSAPLDGSGLRADPLLGGRLSARAPLRTPADEPRLHALARAASELALAGAPNLAGPGPLGTKGVYLSAEQGRHRVF